MQHSAMPPRNKGPSVFTTTDRLQGVTGEIAVFQTPKLRGVVPPRPVMSVARSDPVGVFANE